MSLLHTLLPSFTAFHWNALLGVGLLTTGLGIAGLLRFPTRRLGLGLGVFGALVVSASSLALEEAADGRSAAIVAEATALHVSPASASPVLTELQAGQAVRLEHQTHGAFTAVRLHGKRGWIPTQDVVPLVPQDG